MMWRRQLVHFMQVHDADEGRDQMMVDLRHTSSLYISQAWQR